MTSRESQLAAYFSEWGLSGALAEEMLAGLKPYCAIADTGVYRLRPADGDLARLAESALASFSGEPPKKVLLVSFGALASQARPEWAAAEEYVRALRTCLVASTHGSGLEHILMRDSFRLTMKLEEKQLRGLRFGLRKILLDDLLSSMRGTLDPLCGGVPPENHFFWRGLNDLLEQSVGWAAVGEPERGQKLVGLLALHAVALPLGQKSDEPGIELVLAA